MTDDYEILDRTEIWSQKLLFTENILWLNWWPWASKCNVLYSTVYDYNENTTYCFNFVGWLSTVVARWFWHHHSLTAAGEFHWCAVQVLEVDTVTRWVIHWRTLLDLQCHLTSIIYRSITSSWFIIILFLIHIGRIIIIFSNFIRLNPNDPIFKKKITYYSGTYYYYC